MDARVKCAPLEPEHGYLTVVVTVGATSSTDIVVAYESMDLTATGGTDYVALDGSLTIAPGELTGSFRVDFIDDLVEEGNEEFVVKITPPEGVDIAHDYLHVTIIDEESIKIYGGGLLRRVKDTPMGMLVDVTFSQRFLGHSASARDDGGDGRTERLSRGVRCGQFRSVWIQAL